MREFRPVEGSHSAKLCSIHYIGPSGARYVVLGDNNNHNHKFITYTLLSPKLPSYDTPSYARRNHIYGLLAKETVNRYL